MRMKKTVRCKTTQSVQMKKTKAMMSIQNMGSRDEEEYDADLVAKKFADAFDCYKAEILRQHAQNSQDPSMNKAMMAITKSMNKSITLTL